MKRGLLFLIILLCCIELSAQDIKYPSGDAELDIPDLNNKEKISKFSLVLDLKLCSVNGLR
ncbi:MAG: hypothetical protein JXQ96_23125 [Cyclobacteriaceae bacterium]